MADNREIVGWFYRNGRRIPIRKKDKGYDDPYTGEAARSADKRFVAEKKNNYSIAEPGKDISQKTRKDNKRFDKKIEKKLGKNWKSKYDIR